MIVDGRTLETAWWGPTRAAGDPLVLLHEGLGSVSAWRDFPEMLAARTARQVMAYSRWGHGRSDPPALPHTVRFMHEAAGHVPAVLDASGIPRAVLVGHSDGASIALLAAAAMPERIDALVLLAPHVFVEDVSIQAITATRQRFREGDLRERLARHHDAVDIAFSGWADVWLDPAFRGWNIEGCLPAVTCPLLVIQGADDEYGSLAQVDAIARQAGGPVQTLVVPACGHRIHRQGRDVVLDAIGRFLAAR